MAQNLLANKIIVTIARIASALITGWIGFDLFHLAFPTGHTFLPLSAFGTAMTDHAGNTDLSALAGGLIGAALGWFAYKVILALSIVLVGLALIIGKLTDGFGY